MSPHFCLSTKPAAGINAADDITRLQEFCRHGSLTFHFAHCRRSWDQTKRLQNLHNPYLWRLKHTYHLLCHWHTAGQCHTAPIRVPVSPRGRGLWGPTLHLQFTSPVSGFSTDIPLGPLDTWKARHPHRHIGQSPHASIHPQSRLHATSLHPSCEFTCTTNCLHLPFLTLGTCCTSPLIS